MSVIFIVCNIKYRYTERTVKNFSIFIGVRDGRGGWSQYSRKPAWVDSKTIIFFGQKSH